MGLREAARDAWMLQASDKETQLRTILADVLTPFDVSTLRTVDLRTEATYTMVVVHDVEDNIYLSVHDPLSGASEVHIVTGEPGMWTKVSRREVRSLADLYKLLPPVETPSYPEWVQPTGAHDAYAVGDRVMHDGKVWVSLTAANVWEPGVSGWREVTS